MILTAQVLTQALYLVYCVSATAAPADHISLVVPLPDRDTVTVMKYRDTSPPDSKHS